MELKRGENPIECVSPVLLIVPYGIETHGKETRWHSSDLLIVPYGIETRSQKAVPAEYPAFNRTLWN